jgi:excisionase family DNA binding protein
MTPDDREALARALEAAARTLLGTALERPVVGSNAAAAIQAVGEREAARILLRVPEAAEALSFSRGTIYGLLASGGMPSVRIGRRRLIPRAQLIECVEQQLGEQVHGC